MNARDILFRTDGNPITPDEIDRRIAAFGDAYNNATRDIIRDSASLDEDGEVFLKCTSRILAAFGMTRSGVFHGESAKGRLRECWSEIGAGLLDIRASIDGSGLPRDRYILQLSEHERVATTQEVWSLMKHILPLTMGKTSSGLVGASKILFSVLPEIALPIDNGQWRLVFRTVDFGDVLQWMVRDIQRWESATCEQLNKLDESGRLTTLPSVYNVMAMAARPQLPERTSFVSDGIPA